MQTFNFRNIINIHRLKIVVLLLGLILFLPTIGKAQLNYMEYANKRLYFGISLGYNISKYKIGLSEYFAHSDTIVKVSTESGPGFNLGIIGNLKMGKYFDLRFIPSLVFADKTLNFNFFDGSLEKRTIQSILIELPVSIRFKSQPIKDVRLYVLTGLKYSMDLASNAKARQAEDQVKVNRNDLAYEFGLGLQIFFPLFIFSPEIKFSHGMFNINTPNENLNLSRSIEKLRNRMVTISIHFEG